MFAQLLAYIYNLATRQTQCESKYPVRDKKGRIRGHYYCTLTKHHFGVHRDHRKRPFDSDGVLLKK